MEKYGEIREDITPPDKSEVEEKKASVKDTTDHPITRLSKKIEDLAKDKNK